MKPRNKKYRPRQVWQLIRGLIFRFWYLSRADVFAVTGSCGKTSATHFLAKILGESAPCFVGINQNYGKAILKNLRKVRKTYRYLVQETGVAKSGDMARNLRLLRPNIGIVTTIGQDHYSNFRNLEATAAEKGVLVESLPKAGIAVLNADDPHVLGMRQRTRAKVVTYGFSEEADVRPTDIRSSWPERLSLTITFQGESVRIETDLFGDLLLTSLLAAIAGALAVGISLQQCAASLKGIVSFPHRLSIHRNLKGGWIIDDSFKAPFWSVEKVILLLKEAAAPRKTLVLGTFSDIAGSGSQKYRAMARVAMGVADRTIFVGQKAVHVRKMITPDLEKRLLAFDSLEEACRFLDDDSIENELVLIKSSSQPHLERVLCWEKEGFNCWKNSCEKQISCEECKESGIVASA